jgi:hypothetical protein
MTEGQPDNIQEAVDELVIRVVKQQAPSAAWSGELFVNDSDVNWTRRTVSAESLKSRADAANQFEALLAERRSWIKLSSLGMWHGMLVIEMSWSDRCHPIARSEILYAGFMKMIADDPSLSLTAAFSVEGDLQS